MSLSKYSTTRETTNLARIARIILGPCTDVLRAVLNNQISPTDLIQRVNSYNAANKKPSINKDQRDLVKSMDYTKFDITLLYFLLRNICTITAHEKQWGNIPELSDRSVSANIERIRLMRNEYYGHCPRIYITQSDFEDKWKYLFQSVKELENNIGTSKDYQRALIQLKHCTMDLEVGDNFIQELRNDVTGLTDKIEEMESSSIPGNVREMYDHDILEWKNDDKRFFETHNFPAMLQRVKNQPFVTFVGSPGSGKSATVHHIALKLKEEGYEIFPIKEIEHIETYWDNKNSQVFVIEDVFGKFKVDDIYLGKVYKYKDRIIKTNGSKRKILMTCRKTVFDNEEISITGLKKKENIIDLHSSEFSLTDQDKYDLLSKYNIDKNVLPQSHVSKTSNMFPLSCAQFSKEKQYRVYGLQFFILPVPCVLHFLDEMQQTNKIQYAALVLLMVNQNKLSEDDFEHVHSDNKFLHDVKTKLLRSCQVKTGTDSFQFVNALKAMKETFTKTSGWQYSFVHDSLFEIVAYHFGRHSPDIILRCMNSDYVANYIKIDTCTLIKSKRKIEKKEHESSMNFQQGEVVDESEGVIDLFIQLEEPYYQLFAERMHSDIENGEFKNVFRNQALKHPAVAQAFIKIIEGKSYTELYSIFLSEMRETSKIVPYRRSYDSSYEYTPSEQFRFKRTISYCKRVICLVIYFGHHLILQSIIDQLKEKSKNTHDLFRVSYNVPSCSTEDTKKSRNKTEVGTTRYFNLTDDSDSLVKSMGEYSIERRKRLLAEQFRLLCIGCYSGDPKTIEILLTNIEKDVVNMQENKEAHLFWKNLHLKSRPLVIASKHGFLEIVKKLIEAGACINHDDGSNTPLTAACRNGYLDIVKELIIAKADINMTYNQYTPLAAACEHGHLDIVIELINANACTNLNAENAPITLASKNGHLNIVEELLKHSTDVNPEDYYQTPLSAACGNGHSIIAQMLIKAGANVNPKNKYQAPLTSACKKGNLAIVEALIKAKADVNLKDESYTALAISCKFGFLSIVRRLIKARANVNLSGGRETPLTAACKWGHLHIVKELLKADVCVNIGDEEKITPITAACEFGHLDIIKELIINGADVNLVYGKMSPLTATCHGGYLDIANYLIKKGADVNLSYGGDTPLTAACQQGHSNLVEKLIQKGAVVNEKSKTTTPLLASCYAGHLSIAKQLITAGVDVNFDSGDISPLIAACKCEHVTLVEDLIRAGSIVNLRSGSNTPLTAACKGNNLAIVEHLIKLGADVNLCDKYSTPLIIACNKGKMCFVKALLKAGSGVNQRDTKKNTPLQVACLNGHLEIVDELIIMGARIVCKDEEEKFLTNACFRGHLKYVQLLIKAGANVNQSYEERTPLIAAIDQWQLNIVEYLIRAGANVNQCYQNKTPLTFACERGHLESVKLLINAKADVNLSNGIETPLTIASYKGYLDIVKELLKAGAVINLRDTKETPLTVACEQGHSDVAEELVKSGADINIGDKRTSPLALICSQAVRFNPPFRLRKYGFLCLIAEFIQDRTDFNKITEKETLLTNACFFGCLRLVKEMIKAGMSVNKSDGWRTPLTAACFTGRINVVEVLIEAGAVVNLKDRSSTPLTTAREKHNFDIVHRLLKAGADMNASNENNVLMLSSCYYGSLSVVKELINLGANINQGDKYYTPLTAACVFGHVNVIEELIKAGADVNLMNEHGDTPLTTALDYGHFELVKTLINAGADGHLSDEILTRLMKLNEKRYFEIYYEDSISYRKY